jgi:starvation-inducible DNA-binding protein
METLQELMKKVLADTFALYLKSHNYHWNVEGPNFTEYHAFFKGLYEELHASVDLIAEEIRTLDTYAPGSFKRFGELTDIEDETNVPDAMSMIKRLTEDNKKVLETLILASKLAEKYEKFGLQDFLTGRIDAHEKHGWMLRSFSKK